MNKEISITVIRRIPKYYRHLTELFSAGTTRISSKELSKLTGFTASQIRQDLNNFGGFGQQGYGYNVEELKDELGKILGLDNDYNVVLTGAGNLGHALANYRGFKETGFNIIGIFDIRYDNPRHLNND
ncbi:MAG: redox-sensing transcriptional repressor Rex, partial [Tissierella sp.]|uniref:redox-sensing transcriptional repressor Rex n=1 Tax=Tissierella sp. TaxID=41274 RepID=UPI003F9B9520